MSLRALVILLLIGALLLCIGSVVGSYYFVQDQIQSIAPQAYTALWDEGLGLLLLEQSALVLAASALILLVSFLIILTVVVRPLDAMVRAIEVFTDHGERVELREFGGAPAEIKKLVKTFDEFTRSVEEAHARDMEMSRIKSDFISTAAHQFRTPLTGIRWALEALQKEGLTESQSALVESATEKSKKLVAIVGTLLDISSIESGKHKYTFTRVDMVKMAQAVAADFSELATRTQVSLYVTPPEEELPLARADQERIKWVLDNVIENALRYTPAGGSVRLSLESGAGRVQLHVRDTGIGIKPQDQGNIFERFYRAENAIAKENAGNGLGLYIARTIATDHGGDLNFRSNTDGPGTTFTLSLPIAG